MSQNLFLDPTVSSLPQLTPNSIGNGTLIVDKLTHFTVTQTYTAICTATDPFTVFNILGSLDGPVGVAIVGQQFTDQDNKVFLTIQQGPVLFQVGDTFEFTVAQGTDLTQTNIDTYDELPQKNFGPGIIGENAGDNNIRFQEAALLARRIIQDLTFTSKIEGALGNSISIEYLPGTILSNAFLTLGGITYTSLTQGIIGNNIQIEYLDFVEDIKATAIIQNISYESRLEGVLGNVTTIEYISGGTSGSETALLIGNNIQVQIEDGVSNADDIRIAIGVNPDTVALVDALSTGTGLEPQNIQGPTPLAGGVDSIGSAGNEVVNVTGNLIQIRFENNVSSAQQVFDAVLASPDALLLVTPSITGVSSTAQNSPISATNLMNGTDDFGEPGNEVVDVIDNAIQVTFVNNQSTAQDILTAIQSSMSASALVDVVLSGSGQNETTDIQCLAASDISNGESFEVYSENDARIARFYFRIDNVDLPPGTLDDVPIDILSSDSALTVAIKKAATINAQSEWNVAPPATNTVRIINANIGPSTGVANIDLGVGTSSMFSIINIFEGFNLGEELQSSPTNRTFLAGGLAQGTYSFNTNELSDTDNFTEGNAAILVNGINNQGNETTQGETLKRGKVTLDDDEASNLSGPVIDNTQQTINNIIQNEKAFLFISNEERAFWSTPAGTLELDGDILIFFPDSGVSNAILQSNFPVSIAENESLWVRVDRENNSNLILQKSLIVPESPKGEDIFRLLTRSGDSLVWWDNTLQREGRRIRIGEGAGSGAFQEKIGTGNASQTIFPIVSGLFPVNQESILVFANGAQFISSDWSWNQFSNEITFNTAPELGVEIYVYYITEGESVVPPVLSGAEVSYIHTVSVTEFMNRRLQLLATPAFPSNVLVDVVGGTSQVISTDFIITGDVFDWAGLGLEPDLIVGDQIRFYFFN